MIHPSKEIVIVSSSDLNIKEDHTCNDTILSEAKSDSIPDELSIFDPSIRDEVHAVIKASIVSLLSITLVVIIASNLFFSFAWDPAPITLRKMKIGVLNLDNGIIGQTMNIVHLSSTITLEEASSMVEDGSIFAALIVRENCSEDLISAAFSSNASSIDYLPSITAVYDQARAGVSYTTAITSMANTLATLTKTNVSLSLLQTLNSTKSTYANNHLIVNPVALNLINLHPVPCMGVSTALGISFLQVYLAIMIHSLVVMRINEEMHLERFHRSHVAIFMSFHRLIGAIYLSIWPAIVLLCLGAGEIISGGKFFAFWAFTWLVMVAWGSICHHVVNLLGRSFGVILLLILIALQLPSSGGLLPFEAMPDFFLIGKALPLKAAIEGASAILLGSRMNALMSNILILLGWTLGTYVFVLATVYSDHTKKQSKHPVHDIETAPSAQDILGDDDDADDDSPAALANKKGDFHAAIFKAVAFEIVLSIFLVILLLLMYGSIWNPLNYFRNIKIAVINLDASSSLVANALKTALEKVSDLTNYRFTVEMANANILTTISNQIEEEKYWGVLIIKNNSSSIIMSEASDTISQFDPTKLATFFIDQGKSGSYLFSAIRVWASTVESIMGTVISSILLESPEHAMNPIVIIKPFAISLENIHPVSWAGLDTVISFAPVVVYFGVTLLSAGVVALHAPLKLLNVKYHQRLLAIAANLCIATLIFALWPSLTIVWLQYSLGASRFVAIWMFIWLGMSSFAALFIINFHIFGESYFALMNILVYTIATTGSGATVPHNLQDPFFRLGMAYPNYNIVQGLRFLLYGANSALFNGYIAVLLSWIVFTFVAAYFLPRRRLLLKYSRS